MSIEESGEQRGKGSAQKSTDRSRAVHPHHTQMIRARGQGKRVISHKPGVSTVGGLFMVCDLALLGARVQAQRQIRHVVPHSKPSLRDA